jgi:hypothetical protein
MKKPLLIALAAAAALSTLPTLAEAQWGGGGGYVVHRGGGDCRVIREWRHGELRVTRICRPSYGRWGGPMGFYGGPGYHRGWENRRWHERRWHDNWD